VASSKLKSIARRIGKLEGALAPGLEPEAGRGRRWSSRAPSALPLEVRFGNLRRLPADHQGERHIEIAHCLPDKNGEKWVEFTEVPGPPPHVPPQGDGLTRYLDVVFVQPKASAVTLARKLSSLPDTHADSDQP